MRRVYYAQDPFTALRDDVIEALRSGFELADSPGSGDFVLVYGGDGAMLRAIQRYRHENNRFVGVNGGTVGFLMNDTVEQVLQAEHLFFDALWMVEGEIVTDSGALSIYGFNDVWIERSTERVLKIRMAIDGRDAPHVIFADGLIASTPQGSTGYSHAARGKVIMPGVPVLQITPIAATVNKIPLGSIILSEASEVVLRLEENDRRPARILADNQKFDVGVWRELRIRKSRQVVNLGFARENVFMERVFGAQYFFWQ